MKKNKKKIKKATEKTNLKMVRGVTRIIKEKGSKSDFQTMQQILFPLMAVKKQVDLRQEYKESYIHETLDKVNSRDRHIVKLTKEENQEMLDKNEDLIIQAINTKERNLHITSGRQWIQLREEIDGFNATLDVTPIAHKFNMDIYPIPIESKAV